jgi:hypothetical protein
MSAELNHGVALDPAGDQGWITGAQTPLPASLFVRIAHRDDAGNAGNAGG